MPIVDKRLERMDAKLEEDTSCLYMKFYEAVQTDDDGARSMEKLYNLWKRADVSERSLIDKTLAWACGWTMGSLVEQVLDEGEE